MILPYGHAVGPDDYHAQSVMCAIPMRQPVCSMGLLNVSVLFYRIKTHPILDPIRLTRGFCCIINLNMSSVTSRTTLLLQTEELNRPYKETSITSPFWNGFVTTLNGGTWAVLFLVSIPEKLKELPPLWDSSKTSSLQQA